MGTYLPYKSEAEQVNDVIELPIQTVTQPDSAAGKAAKLSIIAAVIAIILYMADTTILEPNSTAWTAAGIAAIAAIGTGLLASAAAFIKMRNCLNKGVVLAAVAGLLLNGGMLAMTSAEPGVLQNFFKGPQKLTEKELKEMRNVSSDSFVIIEPKMGFRVELPKGLTNYPEGRVGQRSLYSYAKYGANGEPELGVWIFRLGKMLPAGFKTPPLNELKLSMPDFSIVKVTSEKWKSHSLDVRLVRFTSCKGSFLGWDTTVPLLGEAIEIDVMGPQKNQAKCAEIFRQILKSLKGTSNWD